MESIKLYCQFSLLSLLFLLGSCSNKLKNLSSDLNFLGSFPFEMTIHEAMILNYSKLYSEDHYEQLIFSNWNQFADSTNVDFDLLTAFNTMKKFSGFGSFIWYSIYPYGWPYDWPAKWWKY